MVGGISGLTPKRNTDSVKKKSKKKGSAVSSKDVESVAGDMYTDLGPIEEGDQERRRQAKDILKKVDEMLSD